MGGRLQPVRLGEWSAEDVPPVETYLLGASLFSYPQILGDPYRRDALAVALAAGADPEAFPTSRLLAVARNRGEDLRRGRGVVLPSTALVEIAKRNSALVIAAAQGLDDEVKAWTGTTSSPADWKGRKVPTATRLRSSIPGRGGPLQRPRKPLADRPDSQQGGAGDVPG